MLCGIRRRRALTVQGLTTANGQDSVHDLAPAQAIPDFRLTDEALSQDEEWFEVKIDGVWQRRRLHDYHELYNIPGLYEALFNKALKTSSPLRVVNLLVDVMSDTEDQPENLRVLDLGAGNGMVGHELQNYNVDLCVGADIIPEAKEATLRDRPWCYDDYVVADFTDLGHDVAEKVRDYKLNALTCVAALGFGDIPAKAFLNAIDLLETPAYLAFNIKEDFVQERDTSGFADLIRELAQRDIIHMQAYRRYQHRISCAGEPLYYIAMVATKEHEIPEDMLRNI
jgi:SAM-dependent methyltransferase